MSRYARRREPNLPRKQRIELGEVNVPLRALLLGIALLVAALAFGSVINQRLAGQSGWPEIEAGARDWRLLLQIDVGDFLQESGEGTVYFLIRAEDLAERRFDRVVAVYQQT